MTESSIFPTIQSLRNNWCHLQHINFFIFQELNDIPDKKFEADLHYKQNQNSKLYVNLQIFKKLSDKRFHYHNKTKLDFLMRMPEDSYTWLRFTTDIMKIYYQYGNYIESPYIGQLKPYISINTNRKLTNSSFKLGAIKKIQHGSIDLRYKHIFGQNQSTDFLYSKIKCQNSFFAFSSLNCLNLTNKVLQKNDLLISISPFSNHNFGIKLQNNDYRSSKINYRRLLSYFDNLKTMYLFNHDDLKAGILYEYNIQQNESKKFELVMKFKDYNIKLNSLLEVGIKSRFRWQQFNFQIGAKWKNAKRNAIPSIINFKISYE